MQKFITSLVIVVLLITGTSQFSSYQVHAAGGFQLTAEYVDQDTGGKIKADYTTEIAADETYQIPAEVPGYELEATSAPLTGKLTSDTTIQLMYKKQAEYHVTAHYLDADTGNKLHADYVTTGITGSTYTIPAITVDGYKLESEPSLLTGTIADADKEITVYYKKQIQTHKLTAHYIDKDTGAKLHDDYTVELKEGESYSVPEYEIDQFVFQSVTDSPQGVMGKTDKEMTFRYIKDAAGKLSANLYTINKDSSVTGTAEGDIYQICLIVNRKFTPFMKVNGDFEYPAEKYITSPDQDVWVVAYDRHGKELDRVQVPVKLKSIITATTFTIDKDSYIQGTYKGVIRKVAIQIDGIKQKAISVSNGTYKYYAGNKITSQKQDIEVIGYGADGEELDRTKLSLAEDAGILQLQPFKIGSGSYIEGTATASITKAYVEVDGKKMTTVPVKNGKIHYYTSNLIQSKKQQVTVVGLNRYGKELDRKPLVLNETAGTITPDVYKMGDSYLTGHISGDVQKVTVQIDSQVYATISVTNGEFRYYIGNKINTTDQQVKLIGRDKLNRIITSAPVEIQAQSGTVETNAFTVGESYITGITTGDVKKVTVEVDGKSFTTIPASGEFRYYVKGLGISANSKVAVVGKNNHNQEHARTEVTILENKKAL